MSWSCSCLSQIRWCLKTQTLVNSFNLRVGSELHEWLGGGPKSHQHHNKDNNIFKILLTKCLSIFNCSTVCYRNKLSPSPGSVTPNKHSQILDGVIWHLRATYADLCPDLWQILQLSQLNLIQKPSLGRRAARSLTFLAWKTEAGAGGRLVGQWLERTGPTIAHRNTCPLCSAPTCSLIRNSHRIKWEGGGSINCTQTNNSCGCVRNNWALKYPQNFKRPNTGCLHGISSVQESKSSSILKAVIVIYLFLESFWFFEPSVHEFVPCCKHCI